MALRRQRGCRVVHETRHAAVAVGATEFCCVAFVAIAAGPLITAGADALSGVLVDVYPLGVVRAVRGRVTLATVGADSPYWARVAVSTAVP